MEYHVKWRRRGGDVGGTSESTILIPLYILLPENFFTVSSVLCFPSNAGVEMVMLIV